MNGLIWYGVGLLSGIAIDIVLMVILVSYFRKRRSKLGLFKETEDLNKRLAREKNINR